MCVNYRPPSPAQLDTLLGLLTTPRRPSRAGHEWPDETWKDYLAPIVRAHPHGGLDVRLASYGMVPRSQIPPGVKVFDTMNARAESLGERRSFAPAWRRAQLCAVPMTCFYEPCYESGRAERFGIGMRDEAPFFVAGLWRAWAEAGGETHAAFTQITINADGHPLMRRFHKPDDEKRALVVLAPHEVDAWLHCRDPELARSFLRPFPAEAMRAWAAPKTPAVPRTSRPPVPVTGSLF